MILTECPCNGACHNGHTPTCSDGCREQTVYHFQKCHWPHPDIPGLTMRSSACLHEPNKPDILQFKCPYCGREEPNGSWYSPCPSDDCPSNNEHDCSDADRPCDSCLTKNLPDHMGDEV